MNRLNRICVGRIDIKFEAILGGVITCPSLVSRTFVHGNRFALEVVKRLHVGSLFVLHESEVSVQVAFREQQGFGTRFCHSGRRQDEVVFLCVQSRDKRREFRAIDRDRRAQLLGQGMAEFNVETVNAATKLWHGVRCEGCIHTGCEWLVCQSG